MPQNTKTPKSAGNITLTLALILIIAIAVNCFLFSSLVSHTTPSDSVDLRTVPFVESEAEEETMNEPVSLIPQGYMPIDIASSEVFSGELMLVNNSNAFSAEGSYPVVGREKPIGVHTKKSGDYYLRDNYIMLNPTVVENLNAMFADYKEATGKTDIYINAAYRTVEEQEKIYAEKGSSIAAVPGYSEHHTGYAFDIAVVDGGYYEFTDEGHRAWIVENCGKYGFIRRYPEGKTAITGISFEAWHFRYIGVPHANYIMANGLVLEEYIDLVKGYTLEGEHLSVSTDEKTYEIYYVPAAGDTTKVYVPSDREYEISGNNVDGFIVTVDTTPVIDMPVDMSTAA